MLAFSGVLQWRNRSASRALDPALRQACLRTRKTSTRVCGVSAVIYLPGGWFAFNQQWLDTF
ncbi:MAG: hypothetical protein Q8M93_03295 [Polaromonas sp.]|uniref:hypothetical protein n=1 Tax=Polaromonas sp. TaxID=1869339 RepID=UPI00248A810C|nr:hypothetical protein [Polaromonas sp.]MDI1268004.1 hypothetical protein [Polaromonas sp.]MDP2452146.1 hypothetical protein [Polaromonas sp.]MDP3245971.1 hypothetical protein [Polaromonas sp.]MDP3826052.1 hypothetical protein [Polaromonas sp.]